MGQGFWRFQDWRSSLKTAHRKRGSTPASRRLQIDSVGERTRIERNLTEFFGVRSINLKVLFCFGWHPQVFFASFFLPKQSHGAEDETPTQDQDIAIKLVEGVI